MEKPAFETALLTEMDGIGIYTMNQPEKLNALDEKAYKDLALFARYLNESDLRVGIITGAGGKAFAAGADPSERRLHSLLDNWLRRFIAALGRAQASLALHSLLNEFHTAVLGAAVLGGVVGDGFMRALTYGTHVERIAA
jgi:enoyl-CoA hydratase/carnithine racemase